MNFCSQAFFPSVAARNEMYNYHFMTKILSSITFGNKKYKFDTDQFPQLIEKSRKVRVETQRSGGKITKIRYKPEIEYAWCYRYKLAGQDNFTYVELPRERITLSTTFEVEKNRNRGFKLVEHSWFDFNRGLQQLESVNETV